jgi:hypothetical protein
MAFIEKRPPWLPRLTRLIKKSWASHGPSSGPHLSSAFDSDSGEWLIVAAPVFQEVLGGEDDGKNRLDWLRLQHQEVAAGNGGGEHQRSQRVPAVQPDADPRDSWPVSWAPGQPEGYA